MAMPNGGFFWGKDGSNLTTFVKNGSIPEARLTDSKFQLFHPSAFVTNCLFSVATRIVAAWYQLGQDVSPYLSNERVFR